MSDKVTKAETLRLLNDALKLHKKALDEVDISMDLVELERDKLDARGSELIEAIEDLELAIGKLSLGGD